MTQPTVSSSVLVAAPKPSINNHLISSTNLDLNDLRSDIVYLGFHRNQDPEMNAELGNLSFRQNEEEYA